MSYRRFFILKSLKDWDLLEENLASFAAEKKKDACYVLVSFAMIDFSYHKRLDLSLFDYFIASSKYKALSFKNWKREIEILCDFSVSNQEIVFLN